MDDRTLLERAARAAGLPVDVEASTESDQGLYLADWSMALWNPLTDDGDALRLAVKLRLDIDHHTDSVNVWYQYIGTGYIPNGDDPYAATRRAVVMAAAAMAQDET